MIQRFKQLGKDSIVYGIGGALAGAINFFLMPVYTRIFTPTEYGMITMLMVITRFLKTLLVTGMDAAQSFYFFEQKKQGRTAQVQVVTSIFQWRLIWGALVIGLALFISPLLNAQFFKGRLTWIYFVCAFVGCLFESIANQSAQLFRLLYRPWGFISINFGIAIISASIALALIIGLKLGILGVFVGSAAGTLCMAIAGWWANRTYLDWSKWHRDWWPRLLRFGIPLVPAGLAMYVLQTSDRWFISHYRGSDELGLYAVGANFAMMIALVVVTFRQAWGPIANDAIHNDETPGLFKNMARLYLGLTISGVIIFTGISPYLVTLFATPQYFSAYSSAAILAWYPIFFGFFLISSVGIKKREKMYWNAILMGMSAVLNIFLDILLVPIWGNTGAAVATSFSFFAWNVITILISERLWKVGFNFGVLSLQVIFGVVSCAMILYFSRDNDNYFIVLFIACVAVFIIGALSIEKRHYPRAKTLVSDTLKTFLARRSM